MRNVYWVGAKLEKDEWMWVTHNDKFNPKFWALHQPKRSTMFKKTSKYDRNCVVLDALKQFKAKNEHCLLPRKFMCEF